MNCTALKSSFESGLISPNILLSNCRLIDEDSRNSPSFVDPFNLPFYYFLGRELGGSSLLQFGFGLGLHAACYLQGAASVTSSLHCQEPGDGFYNPRLGRGNVRDRYRGELNIHYGSCSDPGFRAALGMRKWDISIITEEKSYDTLMGYLDLSWESIGDDAPIVVDYLDSGQVGDCFRDFCKRKNRVPEFFNTRYGVGLIQK